MILNVSKNSIATGPWILLIKKQSGRVRDLPDYFFINIVQGPHTHDHEWWNANSTSLKKKKHCTTGARISKLEFKWPVKFLYVNNEQTSSYLFFIRVVCNRYGGNGQWWYVQTVHIPKCCVGMTTIQLLMPVLSIQAELNARQIDTHVRSNPCVAPKIWN